MQTDGLDFTGLARVIHHFHFTRFSSLRACTVQQERDLHHSCAFKAVCHFWHLSSTHHTHASTHTHTHTRVYTHVDEQHQSNSNELHNLSFQRYKAVNGAQRWSLLSEPAHHSCVIRGLSLLSAPASYWPSQEENPINVFSSAHSISAENITVTQRVNDATPALRRNPIYAHKLQYIGIEKDDVCIHANI